MGATALKFILLPCPCCGMETRKKPPKKDETGKVLKTFKPRYRYRKQKGPHGEDIGGTFRYLAQICRPCDIEVYFRQLQLDCSSEWLATERTHQDAYEMASPTVGKSGERLDISEHTKRISRGIDTSNFAKSTEKFLRLCDGM